MVHVGGVEQEVWHGEWSSTHSTVPTRPLVQIYAGVGVSVAGRPSVPGPPHPHRRVAHLPRTPLFARPPADVASPVSTTVIDPRDADCRAAQIATPTAANDVTAVATLFASSQLKTANRVPSPAMASNVTTSANQPTFATTTSPDKALASHLR